MFQSKSCKRHYFSIESILATEEPVPCTFMNDENFLGFLEPGNTSENLQAGSNLQLPYWIASVFMPYSRSVKVEFPKPFKKTSREVLKADPTVVDLKSFSRYFYIFGEHLSKSNHREAAELKLILTQTFRRRFRKIMDWSFNGAIDQARILDWSETNVFEATKRSHDALELWMKEDSDIIKASSMITSHKKRKMANTELI